MFYQVYNSQTSSQGFVLSKITKIYNEISADSNLLKFVPTLLQLMQFNQILFIIPVSKCKSFWSTEEWETL